MPQDKAPVCREQVLDLVNVLVCSLVLSVATTLFSILVKYYSSISFLNRSAPAILRLILCRKSVLLAS